MIDWLAPIIPHMKALHVTALALWVGGLFALPLMLARHDHALGQFDYTRVRHATHFAYTLAVTPAAVIAISSGLALIFLREVFVPWLFAKLVLVALLIGFHAWVGKTLVRVAETQGEHDPPEPWLPLALLALPVVVILMLVLAKPELGQIPLPDWLAAPRGGQLPFDVPRR